MTFRSPTVLDPGLRTALWNHLSEVAWYDLPRGNVSGPSNVGPTKKINLTESLREKG